MRHILAWLKCRSRLSLWLTLFNAKLLEEKIAKVEIGESQPWNRGCRISELLIFEQLKKQIFVTCFVATLRFELLFLHFYGIVTKYLIKIILSLLWIFQQIRHITLKTLRIEQISTVYVTESFSLRWGLLGGLVLH